MQPAPHLSPARAVPIIHLQHTESDKCKINAASNCCYDFQIMQANKAVAATEARAVFCQRRRARFVICLRRRLSTRCALNAHRQRRSF
jgi:hypothetical protein